MSLGSIGVFDTTMGMKELVEETEMETVSKIKNSFQRFCDYTSFHGFTELFYTKSLFWTLFWLISLGMAVGITTYQIIEAVQQYVYQSESTLIEPASQEEIIYPPLKLCYSHWIYWVNWEKGYSMQFSKEAILYGLSFLTNIYSTTKFNITDARVNFTDALHLNNMSTLSSFYMGVAKYAPLRWFEDEFYATNYSITGGEYFKHNEFLLFQMDRLVFCHVMLGDEIISHVAKTKAASDYTTNANTMTFSINDESSLGYGTEISDREYNSYMAEWIQMNTPQYWIYDDTDHFELATHNYTSFSPPMILFPEGYSNVGIKLAPETDEYFVTIKASAHRWKSSLSNPCNGSLRTVITDRSCFTSCREQFSYVSGVQIAFSSVYKMGKDTLENLLGNQIFFIEDGNPDAVSQKPHLPNGMEESAEGSRISSRITSVTMTAVTTATAAAAASTNQTDGLKKYCSKKCLQGCERWNFEVGITSSSIYNSIHQLATKKRTNIQIDYPLDGDILMMTESDSQTWENFVGNVGGLLGIWTGASILSFIQMVYLCCCADCECPECHPTTWFHSKRRDSKLSPMRPPPIKRIRTIIVKR